jgi:hypothetical protein
LAIELQVDGFEDIAGSSSVAWGGEGGGSCAAAPEAATTSTATPTTIDIFNMPSQATKPCAPRQKPAPYIMR